MRLTPALRSEYEKLYKTATIRLDKSAIVSAQVDKIVRWKLRYQGVADKTGVPWYIIAVIHMLECSGDFTEHLHNGDKLSARTIRVPRGRPAAGNPPFTWEYSAEDALRFKGFDKWTDWTLAGMLYKLEGYNGWGYRKSHPDVLSPYLWSFTNHYTRGKYVKDGVYSASAVSAQVGIAAYLKELEQRREIVLFDFKPPLVYGPKQTTAEIKELQKFLNTFPGIELGVDGYAGPKTSDAFKRLTGHYLLGDKR